MSAPSIRLLAGLTSLCLALTASGAGAGRTYEASMAPRARYVAPLAPWPQASYRAKDFAILKKGDWYHLFYTRVQRFVPDHWTGNGRTVLNERTFGHAISPDLETWIEMDTVLVVSGGNSEWDAHHLWAPTIVEHNGVTWMLYTGVRDRNESTTGSDWVPRWQRIGIAASTDPNLAQWTRLPAPVWAPCADYGLPGVPWALCNATLYRGTADFRDPFVLAPEAPGQPWLLYYTARPRYDQYNYVAGVAQAPSPAGPWTDLGALWDTYYPPLNSKIESPHVFRRGIDWHLMFTGDDGSTGIAWHTSHGSAIGPWTTRPLLNSFLQGAKDDPYDFDLEPAAWFASEYFSEPTPSGPAEYFAVVHSYDAAPEYNPPAPATPEDISIIEFRRMLWSADGMTFSLVTPNPVRALTLTAAEAAPGETVDLVFTCEGGPGRSADLVATLEQDGVRTPVDPAALGLPAAAALGDPEARVRWTVSTGSFQPPFRVEIAVANQPKRCLAALDVRFPGGVAEFPQDEPTLERAGPGSRLRLLASVTGGAAGPGAGSVTSAAAAADGVTLEMPAAGRARVALYDVAGRHVRTLVDDALPAGTRSWRWDGLDGSGRPVPRGLYFARATTPFGVRTARLLVLR